jgi:hypothetical protein
MLLQRDSALAAMGRRLRYENSTTMLQRGAGNTVRVCTFFVRSVGATSVQVYNRSTTATRLLRGRMTAAQPGYHCTSATLRGSTATELRCTPKSAKSLRRGGTTMKPIHCRTTGAQLFNCCRSARSPVRGGATAAHLDPFDRGAASTGPLRDCTSLTQLWGRRATATRSQSTERSVTASNLRCCTTEGLLRSTTTTRLLRGGVAAVKLCDRGAAAARPQRRNAVSIQRRAVVMQRGGAAMTTHGSAVVTQLLSAVVTQLVSVVVMQRGSAGMTLPVSAVVMPLGSAVVTQRGSLDATGSALAASLSQRLDCDVPSRLQRRDLRM